MARDVSRRAFLAAGTGVTMALTVPSTASGEVEKPAAIDPKNVEAFVRAAHGKLDETRAMLDQTPGLVNGAYDWGGGDWETGLGGASHMGRRDIATFLLSRGARKDIFCAATMGEREVVLASLAADPAVANLKGPHTITLFYHAALGGDVEILGALKSHGAFDDRALLAAAAFGHLPVTRWLLGNGARDLNPRNFRKQTPLDLAIDGGHTEIADLLRKAGGVTGS